MFLKQINYKSTSAITLVVVNVCLFIFAIALNWKLFDILLIFWAESLVIGFFNIFKILKIKRKERFNVDLKIPDSATTNQLDNSFDKIFILLKGVALFTFTLLFFVLSGLQICFIYVLFGDFSLIEFVLSMMERRLEIHINDMNSFLIGVGIVFISHGVSFFFNYIGKKEYKTISLKKLLFAPFRRIILVWIVIAAGSYVIVQFGKNSVLLLIPFFIVKILFDLRQHSREHREKQEKKQL